MKQKKVFACQNCGYQSPKWQGKCPDCSQWNSLVEETYQDAAIVAGAAKGHDAFRAGLKESAKEAVGGDTPAWGKGMATAATVSKPQKISDIHADANFRMATGYVELDRVLGGGIVPGSLVLIGGDPGIGKSTLLMQALAGRGRRLLYVSGEESPQQIKLRAQRLGVSDDELFIYAENCFENIVEQVKKLRPTLLVIDSVQTLYSSQVQSAPGSVSQIRDCCGKLMMLAKTLGIATFLVGHITKEGSIAGPKVLEHMVDTVLYFENSAGQTYRLLRAVKNRFGSTNEIGVFEMAEGGLREVTNPSELFLQERPINAAGSSVVCAIEGSRPLLVEIQALVSVTNLAMPRRTTLGVESNKVALLVAVIEKKLGLPLYGHDIFVNVAGGLELSEPAVDLGVALALVSSFKNEPLDGKTFVCGEVGLAGEVRHVANLELRLLEAKKLGFQSAVVPRASLNRLDESAKKALRGITITGVTTLAEAVTGALGADALVHRKPVRGAAAREREGHA